MTQKQSSSSFWRELRRELRQVWRALADGWSGAFMRLRNRLRAWRRRRLDYVVIPLSGTLPERSAPPRSFLQRQLPLPDPPLSLQELNGRLQAIADADNVRGVLFLLRGFTIGLATAQNLRRAVERLRAAGKECVVYTPYLDLTHYYVAAAANRIIVPPQTRFELLGVRSEVQFFKEALANVGVEVDVVQISPYKSAFDPLHKADLTPEYRAQLEWLLDDQYDMLTADLAADRGMTQVEMQQRIDEAPYFAAEAVAHGLIDALAYEDELATLLAQPEAESQQTEMPNDDGLEEAERPLSPPRRARLRPWPEARGALTEKWRRRTNRFVGVISLQGVIMMGTSRRPPIKLPIPIIGGATAGEETLARLLRRAYRLDNMAALILYIDSGGGSSLASDLIAREVQRLAEKKPILAYMGNVAASGGYYVAAPVNHIMSQRSTLTGSIGVITARPSTRGLFEKLDVNRINLQRGAHADLYSDLAPMGPEEREIFWQGVVETYNQFKQAVAKGRNLPLETLDPICEGRVWTGRQATTHKLVDSHGDFVDAIRKAAEMGDLPVDDKHAIPVVNLTPRSNGTVLPPQENDVAEELSRWLARDWLQPLNGRTLMLMPFEIKFV